MPKKLPQKELENTTNSQLEIWGKINHLVGKTVIPVINLLKSTLPYFEIGNLRQIMDRFSKEKAEGQLRTVKLLEGIIKSKNGTKFGNIAGNNPFKLRSNW